ncbi:MAG: hypothetical protein ACTHMW_15930 [Actinomycetes bacterium]
MSIDITNQPFTAKFSLFSLTMLDALPRLKPTRPATRTMSLYSWS